MPTSVDQLTTQPTPQNFRELMSRISDMIVQRLSESGEDDLPTQDILDEIEMLYGSGEIGMAPLGEIAGQLFQENTHPLLNIQFEHFGWHNLSVLDIGTNQVFTVFDQGDSEPAFGVAAYRGSHQPVVADATFRIHWLMTIEPFFVPDQITFCSPLTESDVRNVVQRVEQYWRSRDDVQYSRDDISVVGSGHALDEPLDPRAVASRHADLVATPYGENVREGAMLWGFDAPDYYVEAIEQHLHSPSLSSRSESESEPTTPMSLEEQRRISLSRLEAMRDGRYVIVDTNQPGAKDAMREALFGKE